MKVMEEPWQKGFEDAVIDIPTGRLGLTVIVMALLVAGLPVGQVAFEVRIQVITSPLFGIYEYIGLFVPTITLLTFH